MVAKQKPTRSNARAHLVLRLKKGWTYDPGRRCFFNKGGQSHQPGSDLPKYSRIRFQVPAMAKRPNRTSAEDQLARGVLIVPPQGNSLEDLLPLISNWPCVEKVWVSPGVSLATPPQTPSKTKRGRSTPKKKPGQRSMPGGYSPAASKPRRKRN